MLLGKSKEYISMLAAAAVVLFLLYLLSPFFLKPIFLKNTLCANETLSDCNLQAQIYYNFISALATALVAVIASVSAIFAVLTYRQNANLERAKWALNLYEKFFEQESLKKIRDTLDCNAERDEVNQLVFEQKSDFTDYLNFFEFVAFLESNKQLKRKEVEALFDYYLKCLKRHRIVHNYIRESDYEYLNELLESWK
jgi:uncharacterized protein YdiU (UPF0061 family)